MIKTRQEAEALAAANHLTEKVVLLGYRSKQSRYGHYDDTLAILTPDLYIENQGNTLPTVDEKNVAVLQPGVYRYQPGLHGISHLRTDTAGAIVPEDRVIYDWLIAHKGKDYLKTVLDEQGHVRLLPYWAFRQAGPVKIHRIGAASPVMDGWPNSPAWIDIHRGGYNLTSSLGCQTDEPQYFDNFRTTGFSELEKYNQPGVWYILVQL